MILKRLISHSKTNGTAVYGIDAEVEGMVYARPVIPPTRYGSEVISVDDVTAKSIDGYLGYEIIKDPSKTVQGWVVVYAENYPSAIKAVDLLKVTYRKGETASVSEADIQSKGERAVRSNSEGSLFVDDGSVQQAVTNSKEVIEGLYITATANHF